MENTNQITVNDLNALRNIVDVAFKRGAFSANEAAEIGAVYNKLTAFLEAVVAQAEPGKSLDDESGDTTSESTQGE